MPASRQFTLTYGAATIGGSSTKYLPTGSYRRSTSNAFGSLELDVYVLGATAQDFEDFEAIWQNVRVIVTLTYLGVEVLRWDHAGEVGGVNTRATCRRQGNQQTDAGLGALYTVTIEADLIPDSNGQDGIRDHRAVISLPEYGQQHVGVISGVFVGDPDDYTAAVDAFCEVVRARNDIAAWHLTNEDRSEDIDAKVIQWTRQYAEHFTGLRDVSATAVFSERGEAWHVTISGKYRGDLASFDAVADAYCAAIKTRLSISAWLQVDEKYDDDRLANLRTWHRTFEESFSGIRDHSASATTPENGQTELALGGKYRGADYDTAVDAYSAAVLERHGGEAGEWQLLSEQKDEDRQAFITTFSRRYSRAYDGIRDHAAAVAKGETDQKRIVISGVYNSAFQDSDPDTDPGDNDDYDTAVDAYCEAVLARHNVTVYDLVSETKNEDRDANVTRWSREYVEVMYHEVQGGFISSVKGANLIIARNLRTGENYGDPKAIAEPVEIVLRYSASIVKSEQSDVPAFYASTIRPFLIAQLTAMLPGGFGPLVIVGEDPTFELNNYRVAVVMLAKAPAANGIIAQSYERTRDIETGSNVVPVRAGSAYAGVEQQGAARYVVTEVWTRRRLMSAPSTAVNLKRPGGNFSGLVPGAYLASQAGSAYQVESAGSGYLTQGIAQGALGEFGYLAGFTGAGAGAGPQSTGTVTSPPDPSKQPSKGALVRASHREKPYTWVGVPGTTGGIECMDEITTVVTQWYDPVESGGSASLGQGLFGSTTTIGGD